MILLAVSEIKLAQKKNPLSCLILCDSLAYFTHVNVFK